MSESPRARPWWLTAGAALLSGAAATATAVGYHARYRAPYRARLESVDVPVTCGDGLAGLRIGFVTDTHIGPMVDAGYVARALQLAFEASPDLICLGGDYVCDSPRYIPEAAAVLGECASAARLGAFAVLGNHDYATDVSRMTAQLAQRGVQVLRNEAVAIAVDQIPLWIVGIDDALLGRPDLERAFAAVPADAPRLALWHEPDWAEQAARRGALLQLSGHSHGGQIRLPGLGHLSAPSGGKRFVRGLHAAAGMPVYTSRGLGIYHPPFRFRCPPEVTILTLIRRESSDVSRACKIGHEQPDHVRLTTYDSRRG